VEIVEKVMVRNTDPRPQKPEPRHTFSVAAPDFWTAPNGNDFSNRLRRSAPLTHARVKLVSTIAFLLSLWISSPAFASDNLELIPDYALFGLFGTDERLGSLWIMLIGFVLLIIPLNALIFQPIFRALDAREERINGARQRSSQLEEEADDVLSRYEAAIREARNESETSRQAQLATAREEQVALTNQSRSEAEGELLQARTELAASLEEARTSLRASAEDLASAAAEQVLGRSLT
jgi:F-type H+-transporting ATPase subunit b